MKKKIGHGGLTAWLEKEFLWTQRTANNFMRVGKLNTGVQFESSALQAMSELPVAKFFFQGLY